MGLALVGTGVGLLLGNVGSSATAVAVATMLRVVVDAGEGGGGEA